jgi:hypothetical protein
MDMNTKDKTTTITGSVLILLGAWVALAPFVVGNWAWEWHTGRFLLAILPGAVTVLGGLVMLGRRPRLVSAGGALALAGGLCFAAAAPVYAFLAGPELGLASDGTTIRLAQWTPFLFVGGALISLLGSYAAGFLKPLEFGDELWSEPAAPKRARVPLPQEHPRRQRGATEPATRARSRNDDSVRRER